jgi:hypothetical protein
VGPNGLRTGHSQVSQSHFGEVTAAGFRDNLAQLVRSRNCSRPREQGAGQAWLATAQSGTGTVRTPQPGRPCPQKIAIRPVNLAQQVADAR